jgi:hypothetical protein
VRTKQLPAAFAIHIREDSSLGLYAMALTFALATARDALAKAQRDYAALESAVLDEDRTRIGDALYNFSISVYHVKDWLIENPSPAYSKAEVEAHVKASPSLLVCRDLCNASKHRKIRKYKPETASVTTSAVAAAYVTPLDIKKYTSSAQRKPTFRVKAITVDGRRLDVLTLGRDAIAAWQAFFQRHGL